MSQRKAKKKDILGRSQNGGSITRSPIVTRRSLASLDYNQILNFSQNGSLNGIHSINQPKTPTQLGLLDVSGNSTVSNRVEPFRNSIESARNDKSHESNYSPKEDDGSDTVSISSQSDNEELPAIDGPIPRRPRKKTSWVWKHFDYVNQTFAKCKHCGSMIRHCRSTASMNSHLKGTKHQFRPEEEILQDDKNVGNDDFFTSDESDHEEPQEYRLSKKRIRELDNSLR